MKKVQVIVTIFWQLYTKVWVMGGSAQASSNVMVYGNGQCIVCVLTGLQYVDMIAENR